MDVLLVGEVVRQLAAIFDAYWNSPQAYDVRAHPRRARRSRRRRASAFDHWSTTATR